MRPCWPRRQGEGRADRSTRGATTPDWDGYYTRAEPTDGAGWWIWGTASQYPTVLSVLTPEYQRRMLQGNYHEAIDNAPQHTASFCYPEGFMRWWALASQGGNFQLTMNPYQVQFVSGIAANFLRQVLIGQTHVQKVPQWYGETVGFWDGDTLVTWTANVQPWIMHSLFEFSGQDGVSRAFKPAYDAGGQVHRPRPRGGVLRPRGLRAAAGTSSTASSALGPLNDPNRRFSYVECLSQHPQRGRPADPAHRGRPPLYRLLRAAVGEELGPVFREGLGQARRASPLPPEIANLFKW